MSSSYTAIIEFVKCLYLSYQYDSFWNGTDGKVTAPNSRHLTSFWLVKCKYKSIAALFFPGEGPEFIHGLSD